jgi:hypothetical protein
VSGDGHFRIRYSIAVIRWFDFASRYIRLRRSCRLMGGFVISPLPHVVERNIHRSGPFPPDAFCCTSINGVGSEVAHRVAPMLATVRRSIRACSFPAHGFHEDSCFRDAIEGIS